MRTLYFLLLMLLVWDAVKSQNAPDDPDFSNPDSQGYRYCAYWKLADGTSLFSTCDPFNLKRCGKRLEYQYKCCTGFKETDSNIFPAEEVSSRSKCATMSPPWESCLSLLTVADASSTFANHMKSGGVLTEKSPAQAVTIFAPWNKENSKVDNIYRSFLGSQNSPINYHVVKGRYYAKDLKNNMELESVYEGQKLKVTKYPYGVLCIECVEIIDADLECKTGVIHLIRKPLVARQGTTADKTSVLSLMQSDDRTKDFASDIPQNVKEILRQVKSGQWFTVFAPNRNQWLQIRQKYGADQNALETIIGYHIVKQLYCSAGLYKSSARIPTLSGDDLQYSCSTERNQEVRRVGSACSGQRTLLETDLMASNGVVHVLDGPLIPLRVKTLDEIRQDAACLKEIGGQKFFERIRNCDLRMVQGTKYSIFLPTDASFDWWRKYDKFRPELNRYDTDEDYRCEVARYHIAAYNPQLDKVPNLWHQQTGFRSNNVDELYETDYFLKNKDNSQLYFHYSPVNGFKSIPTATGSIYRLQRINVMPEKTIMDILNERRDLNITADRVRAAKLNEETFRPNKPLNLFLATVNKGWVNPNDGKMARELHAYQNETLLKMLMLHHVPMYLWGGDIGYFNPNSVNRFMSSANKELIFWMDAGGTMKIGYDGLSPDKWATVIEFNLHAKDGIVWLLDKFLPCPLTVCARIEEFDVYEIFMIACSIKELPGIANPEKDFKALPYKIGDANPTYCTIKLHGAYKVPK